MSLEESSTYEWSVTEYFSRERPGSELSVYGCSFAEVSVYERSFTGLSVYEYSLVERLGKILEPSNVLWKTGAQMWKD